MKDNPKKRDELFKKLIELEKKIFKNKNLFNLRDELYSEIAKLGTGDFFYGDYSFKVKDNFENKNKAYKIAGINRFEVEIKKAKNTP